MEDQELQHLWKQASPEASIQIESSKLTSGLDANLRRFNKEIKNRNLREALAGLLVFIIFSALTYLLPYTLTKIGSAICATFGLVVIAVVNYIKRDTEEDYTLSLKDYLLSQQKHLLYERKLTSTVLYWYILPPTLGMLLFFAGMPLTNLMYVVFSLFVCSVNTVVYIINKNTVKKTIDPLLDQLSQSISQLETKE